MTEKDFLDNNVPPACADSIESERNYQEAMWNKDTTASGGNHSESEFLVFMQDYLREAMNVVSRNPEPMASEKASHIIRKVCAMALACAEKNKWIDTFDQYSKYNKANGNMNLVECMALMQACLNKAFDGIYDNSLESVKINIVLTFMAGTQGMINTKLCPLRD